YLVYIILYSLWSFVHDACSVRHDALGNGLSRIALERKLFGLLIYSPTNKINRLNNVLEAFCSKTLRV
ncbi:MAG: hypothetical protein PUP92_28740, partial [Rhizonema sp. PD38]|nr:hypothetical protein [Rhizonema sp. PD38]